MYTTIYFVYKTIAQYVISNVITHFYDFMIIINIIIIIIISK